MRGIRLAITQGVEADCGTRRTRIRCPLPPLVHINTTSGHGASYVDLFARLMGYKSSVGKIQGRRLWRLIRAPEVWFATLDQDYIGFMAVALARAIQRKPTSGLFLRPLQCFRTDRPIIYPLKRLVFRWLCRVPRLRVISIIPHDIRPELREISHTWIYDPQIWDLWVDGPPVLPETDLSRRVEAERRGRRVLIYIGAATRQKGFFELIDKARAETADVLVVVAGQVRPECTDGAQVLGELGMIVEDRYVSDDEILSLYKVADEAWCRYAPDYDQASGVFGRALQTGVKPLVREGSVLAEMVDGIEAADFARIASECIAKVRA